MYIYWIYVNLVQFIWLVVDAVGYGGRYMTPKKRRRQQLSVSLAKSHLPGMSSSHSWYIQRMITRTVHRSPQSDHTSEENLEKHNQVDVLWTVRVIPSNGLPFRLMRSIGSHSSSSRRKKGKKEVIRLKYEVVKGSITAKLCCREADECFPDI